MATTKARRMRELLKQGMVVSLGVMGYALINQLENHFRWERTCKRVTKADVPISWCEADTDFRSRIVWWP